MQYAELQTDAQVGMYASESMSVGSVGIDEQTPLGRVNEIRRTRNYRPGFGGATQRMHRGGWHTIDHAGRVEGIVLAEYHLHAQQVTQAGGNQRLMNMYSIHYMSL